MTGISDDFRRAAAGQSAQIVAARPDVASDYSVSLCLASVNGRTGDLYRMALLPWVWIIGALALLLGGLGYFVLILTPLVDGTGTSISISLGAIVMGVAMLALTSAVGDGITDGVFTRRLGSRLKVLEGRVENRCPFAVEDPATYLKQKVVSEDYATGGMDRTHPGLILEGVMFRYVIRPADVTEVREDKDYLLVTYMVGGAPVTLALNPLMTDDEGERALRASIKEALTPRSTRARTL